MSDVINLVLQTGVSDEALIDEINSLASAAGVGQLSCLYKDPQAGGKSLEVELFCLTMNGRIDLARQIQQVVTNYREGQPEKSQVVLVITQEDQAAQVIRPEGAGDPPEQDRWRCKSCEQEWEGERDGHNCPRNSPDVRAGWF